MQRACCVMFAGVVVGMMSRRCDDGGHGSARLYKTIGRDLTGGVCLLSLSCQDGLSTPQTGNLCLDFCITQKGCFSFLGRVKRRTSLYRYE